MINRKAKILKFICVLLGFVICSLLYCEYIHYFVVISQCKWPDLESKSEVLYMLAVADTHLLGRRKGHWFDKLRREWQMYRAFQSSLSLHNPDAVVFLGDLFDEGKWCSNEEFSGYISRFNSLFDVPSSVKLLITAGNHDIGFHYSTNRLLSSRFEKAFMSPSVQLKTIKGINFVLINSIAMHGDDCSLCKPALKEISSIAKSLRCAQGIDMEACKEENLISKNLNPYTPPVILQHYPLYRDSDSACSEVDSAPAHEKTLPFKEKWECLSRTSTEMLLQELEPRLVLCGHTHHGCQTIHNYTVKNKATERKRSVLEYTVASFSWRNKVNPTFAMISISKDDFKIYKCEMPNENTVVLLYTMFGVFAFIFLLWSNVKVTPFYRSKFREKLK